MTNRQLLQLKKRYIKEGYKKAQKKLVKEYWEKQPEYLDYDNIFDFDDIEENLIDAFIEKLSMTIEYDEEYEDAHFELMEKLNGYAYDFAREVTESLKNVLEKLTYQRLNKYLKIAQDEADNIINFQKEHDKKYGRK